VEIVKCEEVNRVERGRLDARYPDSRTANASLPSTPVTPYTHASLTTTGMGTRTPAHQVRPSTLVDLHVRGLNTQRLRTNLRRWCSPCNRRSNSPGQSSTAAHSHFASRTREQVPRAGAIAALTPVSRRQLSTPVVLHPFQDAYLIWLPLEMTKRSKSWTIFRNRHENCHENRLRDIPLRLLRRVPSHILDHNRWF